MDVERDFGANQRSRAAIHPARSRSDSLDGTTSCLRKNLAAVVEWFDQRVGEQLWGRLFPRHRSTRRTRHGEGGQQEAPVSNVAHGGWQEALDWCKTQDSSRIMSMDCNELK